MRVMQKTSKHKIPVKNKGNKASRMNNRQIQHIYVPMKLKPFCEHEGCEHIRKRESIQMTLCRFE